MLQFISSKDRGGDRTTLLRVCSHKSDPNWITAVLCMDRRVDCTWRYWIWSPTKVWDCAHRYLEPLLFKVLKWRPTNTNFRLAGWSWACNTIQYWFYKMGQTFHQWLACVNAGQPLMKSLSHFVKSVLYVSNQTKIFWYVVFLPVCNLYWCLVKIYIIIQMKALWSESCGFERNNNVLTIHPKSMARLVEASASVRWLLWTSWLVPCHTACNDSLVSCQGGQKSDTAKNHLSTPIVNRYRLKHVEIMLAWRM